jgi:hypothetical protein
MADEDPSALEKQLEQLTSQLNALNARVAELSAHGEPGAGEPPGSPAAKAKRPATVIDPEEPADVSEELLTWVGKTALLQRMSTLCFLLVIALALRTVTDNSLIDRLAGSALGMAYATILMLAGWILYQRESPLAPVFASCGAVLMCTIVVETHSRFASLPLVPAYLTLMATGIGMTVIGHRYNAFVPASLGTLGMCLAGAAIDYPRPFFPYLALVLMTANILGYFAALLKRCSWLRWIVLLVTVTMFHLWALKITIPRHGDEPLLPDAVVTWFLPALAIFAITYFVLALLGIFRSASTQIARFDYLLPTVTVVWTFSSALYVTSAWQGNKPLLGAIGLVVAAAMLALPFWLTRRKGANAPGSNSFAAAGFALLALSLPVASGSLLFSLAALSAAGLLLATRSHQWENGGIRATTYIVHVYACLMLVIALRGTGPETLSLINMLPAVIMAGLALYTYRWCRTWPPPASSKFFGQYDSHDRSAGLLLLAALIDFFFTLRIGIFQVITRTTPDPVNAFRCSQSVLITLSAAALMLIALNGRNKEIRNVAILVTLVGAVRVFFYDLFGAHGLPLVISLFSFGLAAAVESVALGKWQKQAGAPAAPGESGG